MHLLVCLLASVSDLCHFVLFREILLRVGEVLLVFCFTHLFDALAVRYFFTLTRWDQIQDHASDCLDEE